MRLFFFIQSLLIAANFAAEDMPRVLVLGGSVYQTPAREMAKALKDQVEVVFPAIPPGEVRTTGTALERLDEWLGDDSKGWDLIYFNFGLGDLIYRAPGMKSFRVQPPSAGGVRATTEADYEANLKAIVKRLKATGAKPVWASTTPIRHSATGVFEMGSEIRYNAIAAKVMESAGVPVHDMYSHVLELIDMDKPASHGADPFFFDRKPLHPPIIDTILKRLGIRP